MPVTQNASASACQLCGASVIFARRPAGRTGYKSVVIERCAEGAGNFAMFPTLFATPAAPLAEQVCNGTSFRQHRCPSRGRARAESFTGQGNERKQR